MTKSLFVDVCKIELISNAFSCNALQTSRFGQTQSDRQADVEKTKGY